MLESLRIDNFRLCAYCHKRPSLGRTRIGWLGCVVCQREVDTAIQELMKEKFSSR